MDWRAGCGQVMRIGREQSLVDERQQTQSRLLGLLALVLDDPALCETGQAALPVGEPQHGRLPAWANPAPRAASSPGHRVLNSHNSNRIGTHPDRRYGHLRFLPAGKRG